MYRGTYLPANRILRPEQTHTAKKPRTATVTSSNLQHLLPVSAMIKLVALLSACLLAVTASAQMDDRFYFPVKGLEMPENLNFDTVRVPVGGGDTLFNAFFKAKGKSRANVLLIHGGGGNISSYLFMMQAFTKDGYNVYMVDFRGYGKSTGKPTHQNIAADAPLVFESFRRVNVQNLPLIIYGASMGTQIAARLAQENASAIKGLVMDGGFPAINELAATYVADSLKDKVRASIKPPYAAAESLRSLRVPKLFVHSRTDKEVPYALGEALYQAASEPKELLTYHGEHMMLLRDDPSAIVLKMDQMITR